MSPMPWVRKLVVLCDGAPETPYEKVQKVLEQEFGKPMDSIFERFDHKPVASASVAQVTHSTRQRERFQVYNRQCPIGYKHC